MSESTTYHCLPAGLINNKTYVDNNKPVADCVSSLDGYYVKLALI